MIYNTYNHSSALYHPKTNRAVADIYGSPAEKARLVPLFKHAEQTLSALKALYANPTDEAARAKAEQAIRNAEPMP